MGRRGGGVVRWEEEAREWWITDSRYLASTSSGSQAAGRSGNFEHRRDAGEWLRRAEIMLLLS